MELYNPTALTSELIHKLLEVFHLLPEFRMARAMFLGRCSIERGAAGLACEIARMTGWRGGFWFRLAISCFWTKKPVEFFQNYLSEWIFCRTEFFSGEKKMSIRYTPPQSNMSPKKGPFQKERIVFQPLFFRGEPLVFGGVFFSLVPEWISEWLAYLKGRLIYNSPQSYIQEMERIH